MKFLFFLTTLTFSPPLAAAFPEQCAPRLAEAGVSMTSYEARFRRALEQKGSLVGILRRSIPYEIVAIAEWGNISMPTRDIPDAAMIERFPLQFGLWRSPLVEGLMLSATSVGFEGFVYDLFDPENPQDASASPWALFTPSELRDIVAILALRNAAKLPQSVIDSITQGHFTLSPQNLGSRLALRVIVANSESKPEVTK